MWLWVWVIMTHQSDYSYGVYGPVYGLWGYTVMRLCGGGLVVFNHGLKLDLYNIVKWAHREMVKKMV